MSATPFVVLLRRTLDIAALPQVLTALQETPTLWQALNQDTDLAQRALQDLGKVPQRWTPGNLTRILLDLPLPQEGEPPTEPPEPLRRAAAETYATFRSAPQAPSSPRTVALLTLVLNAQRRVTGSWEGLPQTLGAPQHWIAWREPFAAAYSLAPDAPAMHAPLIAAAPWAGFRLLLHAILALPLPSEDQVARLGKLLTHLAPAERLQALEVLAHQRPHLVEALRSVWEELPLPPPYAAWAQALILRHADADAARQALSRAWDLGRRFQAHVAAELGTLAQEQGDLITAQTAWGQAAEHVPEEPIYLTWRILVAIELGHLETAHRLLPGRPEHPALILAAARLAQARGETQALELAQQALAAAETLPSDLLVVLARLTLTLERPDLALQALQTALQRHPDQAHLHDLAAEAALRGGQAKAAVTHAALALHLAPTPRRWRAYAQALTLGEHWSEALTAWQQALAELPNPSREDRLALARAALQSGQAALAEATVRQVLEEAPEDSEALALLGEALAAQGQVRAAEKHLRRALRQAPKAAVIHLALVKVIQRQGKDDEALETLRLAAQSLPHEASIQATWGRELLARGRFAQALPPLQSAHRLRPDDPVIALDLAQVLLQLHRLDEALPLLQELASRHPGLPGLAERLGEALIQAGRPREAVPVLAQALQQGPITPHLVLHYAKAVLASGEDPALAVRILEKYVHRSEAEIDPDLAAELRLTWGEALFALGRYEQALHAFQGVVQHPPADPLMELRAVKGLARSALATQQAPVATAALEEARRNFSDDPEVLELLSEAYAQAGLADKALSTAAEVFRRGLPTPAQALHFAELARRLEREEQALEVLERAKAAHPGDPHLHLRLAEVHLHLGHRDRAAEVLENMLQAPFQPPLAPEILATVGHLLLQAGRPEPATYALGQALQARRPGHPIWWLDLVQALRQQGAHALALEKADEALYALSAEGRLAPPPEVLTELHLARAEAQLTLGQIDEACESLRRAGETAATADHWERIGAAFVRCADYAEALTAYERALEYPDHTPALSLRAAELACGLLQPNQTRRILAAIDVERLSPQEAQERELMWVALALAERNLEAAAEHIPRAASVPEDYPPALQALALVLRVRLSAVNQMLLPAHEALTRALTLFDHLTAGEGGLAWDEAVLAALDLWLDDVAVELARTACERWPKRPRSALLLARAVVVRAERAPVYRYAEARPSQTLPNPQTERTLWENALRRAAQALGLSGSSPQDWVGDPVLGRWALRGLALWTSDVQPGDLLGSEATPGDVAAAIGLARRLGRRFPHPPRTLPHRDHPQVQVALALSSTDPQQALPHAQRAAEKAPSNAVIHALWGRLSLEVGDPETALQAYQAALVLAPDNPRWHVRAAEAADQLGEIGLRLQHLEQAQRLEPVSLQRAVDLAQAYAEAGQGERALEVLRSVAEAHPDDVNLMTAFAQVHHMLGQLDEALRWLRQAHQQAPEQHEITLRLARLLLEAGQVDEAEALLAELPLHVADQEETVLLRAQIAEQQGRPEQALHLLEAAATHAEDPVPLLVARAELLARTKGPKAALEAWEALTEVRPDLPALWVHLAEALTAANKHKAAQQAAQKALQGLDALPAELQARLHLLLGRLARRQGQLDRAVYHLSESITAHPTAEAYLELGQAEVDRRRPDRALKAWEQATELAPDDARPYYLAGLLYRDFKDYPQAERLLRRAAQLDPDNSAIRRSLAAVAAINLIHPFAPKPKHEG